MITVWAVVGPTASGKSLLALELAQKIGGEVVSCDSVQIYKYFDIGTAKLTVAEMRGVPHHLIDLLEPDELCTAGFWRDKALDAVCQIVRKGKVPIIVGGTGLYLKSLYRGMFNILSRDNEVRCSLESRARHEGLSNLYRWLQDVDPVYARQISESDKMRILRALEAITVTGQPFSQLHNQNVKPNWQWMFVTPECPRSVLHQRIEDRVYTMLDHGLVQETESLLKRFNRSNRLFTVIGYRHVVNYLNGVWSYDDMIGRMISDTRQFAKRQLTLFRSLLHDVHIIKESEIF